MTIKKKCSQFENGGHCWHTKPDPKFIQFDKFKFDDYPEFGQSTKTDWNFIDMVEYVMDDEFLSNVTNNILKSEINTEKFKIVVFTNQHGKHDDKYEEIPEDETGTALIRGWFCINILRTL